MESGKHLEDEETSSICFPEVSFSDVIKFIEGMNLPEDDLGNLALTTHLRNMEKMNLAAPRVVLFNQKGKPRKLKWEAEGLGLSDEDRSFLGKPFDLLPGVEVNLARRRMVRDRENGILKVRSVHLGNPDDEKLFLSVSERKRIDDDASGKAVSFNYLCSDERDFPGLLIYLFGVAVGPESGRLEPGKDCVSLAHGRTPTVGLSVSLPRSDCLKGKSQEEIRKIVRSTKHSYMLGKVYMQNRELGAYEDEYEDDE